METPVVSRSKSIAEQVQVVLVERIRQGVYLPDQRMPSEERLAEELQVSRGTLRTALTALAAEGYIRRRQGDGTYVSPSAFVVNANSVRIWDIERQIKASGREPRLQVLDRTVRPALLDELEVLQLDQGQEVLSIRLLFFADDMPILLVINCIATRDLQEFIPPQADCLPWFEFLDCYSKRKPFNGRLTFLALSAEPEIAAYLKITPGSSLLTMLGTVFDQDGIPLSFGKEYYIGQEGFQMTIANC